MLWPLLLLAAVVLVWASHYERFTREAWATPIVHTADQRRPAEIKGDVFWGLAAAKAHASDEVEAFGSKNPAAFGAPFRGNWNDYPSNEEGISAGWALLVQSFGLFTGSNLLLLTAHLLAAFSFYWVALQFGYGRVFAVAGAILFSFTRYALWRGMPHITLTFYWHVPLALLVVWWCARDKPVGRDTRKLLFCAFVAVIHGIQNPYYAAIFVQLLAAGALFIVLRSRDWRRVILPSAIILLVVGTVVAMNIDTFRYRADLGVNPAAVDRPYSNVEVYALKPLELFLPFSHEVDALARYARESYYDHAMFLGEPGSAYLGCVAIAGLVLLGWMTFRGIVRRDVRAVPLHFWVITWLLALSVVGGINATLALFDLSPFRASNRYSIVILAVLLLFVVRQLSLWAQRKLHPALQVALASLLVLIGLYDQVPSRAARQERRVRTMIASDKQMVSELEGKLTRGAMIFQLPVVEFPEAPPVKGMTDYEHFRPYLHSTALRYSYGTNKGRERDRWQNEVEKIGPAGFVRRLEHYGFSAVLIHRHAYENGAASILDALRTAGRSRIVAQSRDFVCIALNPARKPGLPPEFGNGWYGIEGDDVHNRRWSSGDATLVLHNPESKPRDVLVVFGLATMNRRVIEIRSGKESMYRALLQPHDPVQPVFLRMQLAPGGNEVAFLTNGPARIPGGGDERKLAFNITDFRIITL